MVQTGGAQVRGSHVAYKTFGSSAATLPAGNRSQLPRILMYMCLPAAHSNEYSRTTLSLPATARCVRQASTLCMPTGRGGPPCSSTRWGRAGDASCAVQQAGPRHAHLHGTRSNLLRSVTTPTNCSNNTESLVHCSCCTSAHPSTHLCIDQCRRGAVQAGGEAALQRERGARSTHQVLAVPQPHAAAVVGGQQAPVGQQLQAIHAAGRGGRRVRLKRMTCEGGRQACVYARCMAIPAALQSISTSKQASCRPGASPHLQPRQQMLIGSHQAVHAARSWAAGGC